MTSWRIRIFRNYSTRPIGSSWRRPWRKTGKNNVAQQELEIICKNRGLAAVIMSSVPLFEDGQFSGAFAMFSDVTALRETEKRFRKIFEEAAIGMCSGGHGRPPPG